MNNLLDIKNLNLEGIKAIFDKASQLNNLSDKKKRKILRDKTVANIFFENSTRTQVSFELAAKKLGADVININIDKSSTVKGETLKDTFQTLAAMPIDAFVIRHPEAGIFKKITQYLPNNIRLINAGDGNNQHPTQALLDTFTIHQHKPTIENLKISIIGDIKHSRVANSLIDALNILGNQQIHLYGPEELLPDFHDKAIMCQSMQQAVIDCDVIVMLRIQKERIINNIPNLEQYHQKYGLSSQLLDLAKSNCIVMHPGPINRDVEISSHVADNPPSVILEQVKNGVLIRQAVLASLFDHT